MCSKDGSAWSDAVEHSKSDFQKIGSNVQGDTILFNMEKVCTGDEKSARSFFDVVSNGSGILSNYNVQCRWTIGVLRFVYVGCYQCQWCCGSSP